MSSDKALAKYVEKMYEIQFSQKDNILTPTQLKEIALEMGITEQEWEESQQVFQGHLANGKELLLQQNWTDAIQTLESAVALNPYHLDALYLNAQAHVERFEDKKNSTDETHARELLTRALQVQPGHKPSLKLLSKLREEKDEIATVSKKQKLLVVGVASGVILLIFLWSMMVRNAVVKQQEGVKQAWSQVENVYQRRADLIPKLVKTVKSASNFEMSLIDKVADIHKNTSSLNVNNLSSSELETYQTKQAELTEALNELFEKINTNPELSASQAFSDLQVQIEGSENRISVERRKYNQAVQVYNTYIRQFPQSILGFEEKAYFKANKDAMKNPKVDL